MKSKKNKTGCQKGVNLELRNLEIGGMGGCAQPMRRYILLELVSQVLCQDVKKDRLFEYG